MFQTHITVGPQLRRAQGNSQENSPHPPTLRMVEREKKHCIKKITFKKKYFQCRVIANELSYWKELHGLKTKNKNKKIAPFKDIL
jgi:hypothetical protein